MHGNIPGAGILCWAAAALLAMPGAANAEVLLDAGLAKPRRELIRKALASLTQNPAVPYRNGGADATGMDCSGAMVFLLKQVDVTPPRSSHAQYEWLENSCRLTLVPTTARTADDPVFRTLQPGDLIFWAHDGPDAPEVLHITHVHMFLGKEADGHAVMIGSSDGRSYRGKKLSGFGIVDFHVPKAGSPTRIVGFGSPFGVASEKPKP